jgi:hypothetical protein
VFVVSRRSILAAVTEPSKGVPTHA